jgi:hypothetical protein
MNQTQPTQVLPIFKRRVMGIDDQEEDPRQLEARLKAAAEAGSTLGRPLNPERPQGFSLGGNLGTQAPYAPPKSAVASPMMNASVEEPQGPQFDAQMQRDPAINRILGRPTSDMPIEDLPTRKDRGDDQAEYVSRRILGEGGFPKIDTQGPYAPVESAPTTPEIDEAADQFDARSKQQDDGSVGLMARSVEDIGEGLKDAKVHVGRWTKGGGVIDSYGGDQDRYGRVRGRYDPLARERLDFQREREANLQGRSGKNLDIRKQGQELSEKKEGRLTEIGNRVPDPDRRDIASIDYAMNLINRVGEAAKTANFGPIEGRYQLFARKLGLADSDTIGTSADLASAINSYIYASTGKQLNQTEMDRLINELPAVWDSSEVFQRLVQGFKDRLTEKRDFMLEALESQGRNTGNFRASPALRGGQIEYEVDGEVIPINAADEAEFLEDARREGKTPRKVP